MYRSKHDPAGAPTGSTFGTHGTTQLLGAGTVKKKTISTFGPGTKLGPNPKEFLRRGDAAGTRNAFRLHRERTSAELIAILENYRLPQL